MTIYESRIPHALRPTGFGQEVLVAQTHTGSPLSFGWPCEHLFGPFEHVDAARAFLATRTRQGEAGVHLVAAHRFCAANHDPTHLYYRVERRTPFGPCFDEYEIFNG